MNDGVKPDYLVLLFTFIVKYNIESSQVIYQPIYHIHTPSDTTSNTWVVKNRLILFFSARGQIMTKNTGHDVSQDCFFLNLILL